jgi:competence protein ComEC
MLLSRRRPGALQATQEGPEGHREPWWRAFLLFAALVAAGGICVAQQEREFAPDHVARILRAIPPERPGIATVVLGTVVRAPETRDGSCRFVVSLREVGGERACGRILARVFEQDGDIGYGDILRLNGNLHLPRACRTPGAFNYRDYLSRQGIHGELSVPAGGAGVTIIARSRGNPWVALVVLPVRHTIQDAFTKTLEGEARALLNGIVLGERADLPPSAMEAFSRTGVVHILAVSGFNVGLVALLALVILRTLRVPRRGAVWSTMGVLFLYAWVTELSPSVVRATIMGMVLLAGTLLERECHPLNSLAFAALIILRLWPLALFDPGFQLSLGATFGILHLLPCLSGSISKGKGGAEKLRQWITLPLLASLSAQVCTAPLVAYYFFRLPWIALLANLVVVPLVASGTALGFALVICWKLAPAWASLVAEATRVVLQSVLQSVLFLDHVPYGCFRVPRPGILFIIWFLALVVGIREFPGRPRLRVWWCFLLLIGLNWFTWFPLLGSTGRYLEISFLDVGQGDCAVIRFPNGRTMVVDAGDRNPGFDAGERIVGPFLWREGIGRIDVLLLTHPDDDHIGGAPFVLRNFRVGLVLDPGEPAGSVTYREVLEVIRQRGIPCAAARAGDSLTGLGEASVEIFHPPKVNERGTVLAYNTSTNNLSVVTSVRLRTTRALFMGDCEVPAEEALPAHDLRCTVLKVSHHGSRTATSAPFVAAAQPGIAVVSVGQGNRFGLPSSGVLGLLEEQGARIVRTDRDGWARIRTDGNVCFLTCGGKSWRVSPSGRQGR